MLSASGLAPALFLSVPDNNNPPGGAIPMVADANYTNPPLKATYEGQTFNSALFDSGSADIELPQSVTPLPVCNGFYCPSAPTSLQATLTGTNGGYITMSLAVVDPSSLISSGTAYYNIAAPSSTDVLIGLPFFFGHSLYFAIEGRATPLALGPYYTVSTP